MRVYLVGLWNIEKNTCGPNSIIISFALSHLAIIVIDVVCDVLCGYYYCHMTGRDTQSGRDIVWEGHNLGGT